MPNRGARVALIEMIDIRRLLSLRFPSTEQNVQ